MHLISALIAGISGAEDGSARITARGTSTRATWYSDFGATSGSSSTSDLTLDSHGRVLAYVNQLVTVVVYDEDGEEVTRWDDGANATAIEIISPSVTGADYITGLTGVNKPTTFQAFLALWIVHSGGQPWPFVDPFAADVPLGLAAAIGLGQGGEFNVKKYGAVGDGSTNDTAALTTATAAASAVDGSWLVFPPGDYLITAALAIPAGVSVRGTPGATNIIVNHATANGLVFAFESPTTSYRTVKDIGIYPAQSNTGRLIQVGGALRLQNVAIGQTNPQHVNGTAVYASAGSGYRVFITDSYVEVGLSGSHISATSGYVHAVNVRLYMTTSGAYSGTMVTALYPEIVNCWFYPSGQSSGASIGLTMPAGGSGTLGNCSFWGPVGGTFTGVNYDSAKLNAGGLKFATGVTPFSAVVPYNLTDADGTFLTGGLSGAREGRFKRTTSDASPYQLDTLNHGTEMVRRFTAPAGATTLNFDAPPHLGARFTLIYLNDHASTTTGTVTPGDSIKGFAAFTLVAQRFSVYEFVAAGSQTALYWTLVGSQTALTF